MRKNPKKTEIELVIEEQKKTSNLLQCCFSTRWSFFRKINKLECKEFLNLDEKNELKKIKNIMEKLEERIKITDKKNTQLINRIKDYEEYDHYCIYRF